MNLNALLNEAVESGGLDALAERFGVSREQAASAAAAFAPALSAGMRRAAQSPSDAVALAQRLRDTDAQGAAEPGPDTGETQGAAFLDQLFGGARPEVEQAAAERASASTGLGRDTLASMAPGLAALVLGALQKRESSDSAMSGVVGALLGGGGAGASSGGLGGLMGAVSSMMGGGGAQSGGDGLGGLMAMLDADGDGSAIDDIMEKFSKGR